MSDLGVACDCSPSEQFSGNDECVHVLAMAAGFGPSELDAVGSKHSDPEKRYQLRKWTNSSKRYKKGFIDHAWGLVNDKRMSFGASMTNEKKMRKVGLEVWERKYGKLPPPHSVKKGNKRYQLGGYRVDGSTVEPFIIKEDDLAILGWYAQTLTSFHNAIEIVRKRDTTIDFIVDRLPLDTKSRDRTILLKQLVETFTNKRGFIYQPEKGDHEQRDLLVDNLAGLMMEIVGNPNSEMAKRVASLPGNLVGIFRDERITPNNTPQPTPESGAAEL